MTLHFLFLKGLSRIIVILIPLLSIVLPQDAWCDVRSKILDSSTVSDLSISLFRDNYDIWAGEMINHLLAEDAKQIAPLQDRISGLSALEKKSSEEIRNRLMELYNSSTVDETSVRAAILLSASRPQKEKTPFLRNAVKMAQTVAPGSLQSLRVALLYLSHLISSREYSDALRFKSRLNEMAAMSTLRGKRESCLAFILSGDVDYQNSQFGQAEDAYQKAAECEEKLSASEKSDLAGLLLLRRVWSSFRLMKYGETLQRFDQLVSLSEFWRIPLSASLKSELSVMLAVSFSELALPLPSHKWLDRMAREPWIAQAFVRTIDYQVQKEQTQTAVQWVEAVESKISSLSAAIDFYSIAVEVYERSGAIEKSLGLRTRAAIALHPREALARSVILDAVADERRKKLLIDWSRTVIEQRSQQQTFELKPDQLTTLFRITEGLYEEKGDACSELPTMVKVHGIFSGALQDRRAEKVFAWLKDCLNFQPFRKEVLLNRMDMFRNLSRQSTQDAGSWISFIEVASSGLEDFNDDSQVRRSTMEAISDAIERKRSGDAENIFLLQLLTLDGKSESAQWEYDGLVAAAGRLIALGNVSPQMHAAGWSLLARLSESSSSFDARRRQLEAILAFDVSRSALEARQAGRLLQSSETLSIQSQKFSDDSIYGRDLLFQAVQSACLSGMSIECLSLSKRYLQLNSQPDHDLFLVSHWRSETLIKGGRFLAAAELNLTAAQHALDSQRVELMKIAKRDLVRSGDIFTELKFWSEALMVKAALTKVSSLSADSGETHTALLRWSLEAVTQGSMDVAAAMSADLGLWMQAVSVVPAAQRKVRAPLQSAIHLTEAVTKAFASGAPPSSYFPQLSEALIVYRENRGVFLPEDRRFNEMFVKLLVSATSRWQRSLIDESETVSRVADVASVDEKLRRLSRTFDDLVKSCSLLDGHYFEVFCLSDVTQSFRKFSSRMAAALIELREGPNSIARRLDGKIVSLQSKVSSLESRLNRRSKNSESSGSGLVERRGNLLGILTDGAAISRGAR